MKYTIYIFLILSSYYLDAQLLVTDIRSNLVNLDSLEKPAFVMFYRSPSCHQCFINLVNSLKLIDSNVIIYTVIDCRNDIIQKKEIQTEISSYYSSRAIFYNIIDRNQGNIEPLFKKYHIKNTPALLYISDGLTKFISYDAIFNERDNLQTIKNKILKMIFFKEKK